MYLVYFFGREFNSPHLQTTIENPLKTGLRQRASLGLSKERLRGKLCLPTFINGEIIMQFNTIGFIVFFSLCLFFYYQLPPHTNKWFLLGCSLFFYSCFSYHALMTLVLVSIVSWFGEIIIRKVRKKFLLFLFLILTLLPLMLLKYAHAVPQFILPPAEVGEFLLHAC